MHGNTMEGRTGTKWSKPPIRDLWPCLEFKTFHCWNRVPERPFQFRLGNCIPNYLYSSVPYMVRWPIFRKSESEKLHVVHCCSCHNVTLPILPAQKRNAELREHQEQTLKELTVNFIASGGSFHPHQRPTLGQWGPKLLRAAHPFKLRVAVAVHQCWMHGYTTSNTPANMAMEHPSFKYIDSTCSH